MDKSFRYDGISNQFLIARHQIGDFGLHLSLIRSFSWGDNFPIESPFFPGISLPYHYYFDLLVGLLEKAGVRIDMAFNGLSILFFTLLLYIIYRLPQIIFKKSKLLGMLSVILFIFHSNLTFIDFLREKGLSLHAISDLWHLPDYINKGPFDGSLISIFFTMNVYLNQRHLIAALAISLIVFLTLIPMVTKNHKSSYKIIIFLGFILGMVSRVHTLAFFSTSISILIFFILFRRFRFVFLFFVPLIAVFSFHAKDIIMQDINHALLNIGFLSEKPFSILSFASFWFANLGLAIFMAPVGFFLSNHKQKKIFLCFLPLFILANIFQFSYRIDHNHSMFNLFIIIANFYIANSLLLLWKGAVKKIFFFFLLFLLTFSGIIDIMPAKNDFHYPFLDAPSNKFMQWIKTSTQKNDIFLAKQEILDPVTLSGRYNYLGHDYYLSVMGYDTTQRKFLAKTFFEARDLETVGEIRKEKIVYIVVPTKPILDFNYNVDVNFFDKYLKTAYRDDKVVVYKL